MNFRIRIGTRPSPLARAQTEVVKQCLERALKGLAVEVVAISTSGDKLATAELARVGGKGLFIKELEQALIEGVVDVAVHSMKDVPAAIPARFRIAAVPERENPHDALITRERIGWKSLPPGARLGTSSTRRRFEALRSRPDLEIVPLRGNVDTRMRRLDAGDFDAIILAMAGLKRLRRCEGANLIELDEREFVPSGGQGALAIEALADRPVAGSPELDRVVGALSDSRAFAEVTAERAFLATIGASCVSPVGVKGTVDGAVLQLRALLFNADGSQSLVDEITAAFDSVTPSVNAVVDEDSIRAALALGNQLGHRMLDRGAAELIQRE